MDKMIVESYSYFNNGINSKTKAEQLYKINNKITKHNLYGNLKNNKNNKTVRAKLNSNNLYTSI